MMIENFHIIAHTVVLVGFLLFLLYARSKQKRILKNFGSSNVTEFEGNVIPNFPHWNSRDKSYVADLAYVLMKLDLADPEIDKDVINLSSRPARDRFAAKMLRRATRK